MHPTLALEKLYHHIFSTTKCDSTSIDHLKHDLVLWLNHHSFEELPDALEYYLADPNSDLDTNLTQLNLLDQRGVQVTIRPLVTIYIRTLLAWAKFFLATYGEYPGLHDLLDTPRSVFIAAQLHLHDSTFPRPLLPHSRGPPTLQNEPVALQPHLAPPTPPDHLYICLHPHPSIDMSICHKVTSPSIITSVHLATSPSVNPCVCHSTSPSVHPSVHYMTSPSISTSICHSTHPSVTPPIHPLISPSDHPSMSNCPHVILPCPSDSPSLSDHSSAILTSPSDCPSPPDHLYANSQCLSACPSPSEHLNATPTCSSVHQSFTHMTQCMHDSSQSLAVMNGKQSHKAKNFHSAFPNYDLLLCALDEIRGGCSHYTWNV